MNEKIIKFLSLTLIFGRLFGLFWSLLNINNMKAISNDWYFIYLIINIIFVLTIFSGWRLWKGDRVGLRWGVFAFALQVPVIVFGGLAYQYYSGLCLNFVVGGGRINIGFEFGTLARIFYNSNFSGSIFGINIFALGSLIYLIKMGILKDKRKPELSNDSNVN